MDRILPIRYDFAFAAYEYRNHRPKESNLLRGTAGTDPSYISKYTWSKCAS